MDVDDARDELISRGVRNVCPGAYGDDESYGDYRDWQLVDAQQYGRGKARETPPFCLP